MLSHNHQNHKQWPNGAIFLTISPFLVIDDNTIKESINFARIEKLIPIETTYTCLDAYHHPMLTWPPPKSIIPLCFSTFLLLLLLFFPFGIKVAPPWEDTHCHLALIQISPPLKSNHLKRLGKTIYLKREKLVANGVSSMNHDLIV